MRSCRARTVSRFLSQSQCPRISEFPCYPLNVCLPLYVWALFPSLLSLPPHLSLAQYTSCTLSFSSARQERCLVSAPRTELRHGFFFSPLPPGRALAGALCSGGDSPRSFRRVCMLLSGALRTPLSVSLWGVRLWVAPGASVCLSVPCPRVPVCSPCPRLRKGTGWGRSVLEVGEAAGGSISQPGPGASSLPRQAPGTMWHVC